MAKKKDYHYLAVTEEEFENLVELFANSCNDELINTAPEAMFEDDGIWKEWDELPRDYEVLQKPNKGG